MTNLCDAACMKRPHFPIAFRGIDGIRSTQLTMRYFLKLTPMGKSKK